MRVWFDLDGVLSNWCENIIPIANEIWPGKLAPDFLPSDYAYSGIFSAEDWNILWNEIKTRSDFWFKSPAIEKNVKELREWLQSKEHEVFYITSRMNTGGANAHGQTLAWLMKHGLRTTRTNLIVVSKASEKKKHILEQRLDMGVDDLPSTVEEANTIPTHSCFLLSQPWNLHSDQPRVESLQQFLNMVPKAAGVETEHKDYVQRDS